MVEMRMKFLIPFILLLAPAIGSADPLLYEEDQITEQRDDIAADWETRWTAGAMRTVAGYSAYVDVCERGEQFQSCLSLIGGSSFESTLDVSYVFDLDESLALSFGTGISSLTVLVLLTDLILLMADSDDLLPIPATHALIKTELAIKVPINRRHKIVVVGGVGYHGATANHARFPRGIAVTLRGGFSRRHSR